MRFLDAGWGWRPGNAAADLAGARWRGGPRPRRASWWHRRAGVPGIRVHGRDHAVFGDHAGDPPPDVSPVRPLRGLHVLPGDQRQRRSRRLVQVTALQLSKQRIRVVHHGRDQGVLHGRVVPIDLRLARPGIVMPGATLAIVPPRRAPPGSEAARSLACHPRRIRSAISVRSYSATAPRICRAAGRQHPGSSAGPRTRSGSRARQARQQHLVDVVAGQPIRRGDHDQVKLGQRRMIPQPTQPRSAKTGAAVAVIAVDMLLAPPPAAPGDRLRSRTAVARWAAPEPGGWPEPAHTPLRASGTFSAIGAGTGRSPSLGKARQQLVGRSHRRSPS